MIDGKEAIIISEDEARAILKIIYHFLGAIRGGERKTPLIKHYKILQGLGGFDAVTGLDTIIRGQDYVEDYDD